MDQAVLSEIAGLARMGRLDDAALRAQRALATGSDPALLALAGAIETHRGRFAESARLLRRALDAVPHDNVIRGNLAEALYRAGDVPAAAALATDEAVAGDRSLRLARIAAAHAQDTGDFPRAVSLYREIVRRAPDDWSAWNNLGNACSGAEDYTGATEALARAVALAPDAAPIRVNYGNALAEAGRGEDCERVLREAARDFPEDPEPLLALSRLLRPAGREDEAYEALREAAERAPDHAGIRSDYGQESARRNEYAVAEREFTAALGLQPDLGPAYVGLGNVFERMNREDELDPLHARAVASGVNAQSVAYLEALQHKRSGDFAGALDRLDFAGDAVLEGRGHHLRGTLLDRLGRHDEALAEFAEMNAVWIADPTRPRERAVEYRSAVTRSHAALDSGAAEGWTPLDRPQAYATPAFLVGFPRSGTTLLDTMLMADPRVAVLEEEPFMSQIDAELGGTAALAGASADDLAAARERYFEKVGGLVPLRPDSRIVDKHPMHLNKAPVIERLFPDAKFILALRHPCDVLLSCYITNFRPNNAMANFLDLEDAATLYDMTFAHWERAREVLELPVHTVVYERLVIDTARELVPLFDWLGLDWPGDDHDHREAARRRGTVATASYSQVTEPIYTRSSGRWRRYRDFLEPIFPRIAPWVEKFGYSLDDDRIPGWPDETRGA